MYKYRFSHHLPNRTAIAKHFVAMALLSVGLLTIIAVLSRSELRLSGELLAAGNGDNLLILTKMNAYNTVERVRQTEDIKLYLLTGGENTYLVHVKLIEGEWVVEKVEKMRR
jgi:Co/Zn/Cd efflux system component